MIYLLVKLIILIYLWGLNIYAEYFLIYNRKINCDIIINYYANLFKMFICVERVKYSYYDCLWETNLNLDLYYVLTRMVLRQKL